MPYIVYELDTEKKQNPYGSDLVTTVIDLVKSNNSRSSSTKPNTKEEDHGADIVSFDSALAIDLCNIC